MTVFHEVLFPKEKIPKMNRKNRHGVEKLRLFSESKREIEKEILLPKEKFKNVFVMPSQNIKKDLINK